MNGNLDTSDVLLNRGLNGGYGFGQGAIGSGHGNFPGDGSAVKEGVRGNRDIQLLESVNGNAQSAALANQIRQHNDTVLNDINIGNQFITDRIAAQGLDFKFANISDQLASAERLAFANAATVQREMNANQIATITQLHAMDLKQTECCCKLEAGQASILAKLDAQALADLRDTNARMNTEIQIRNNIRQTVN
jgi:hypothetical protein